MANLLPSSKMIFSVLLFYWIVTLTTAEPSDKAKGHGINKQPHSPNPKTKGFFKSLDQKCRAQVDKKMPFLTYDEQAELISAVATKHPQRLRRDATTHGCCHEQVFINTGRTTAKDVYGNVVRLHIEPRQPQVFHEASCTTLVGSVSCYCEPQQRVHYALVSTGNRIQRKYVYIETCCRSVYSSG